MYVVCEISGKQYKAAPGDTIVVDNLNCDLGQEVIIDKVLMLYDAQGVKIGTPTLSNVQVKTTVVGNFKGEKIKVFKFKRRKGYKKTQGHRQDHTEILINEIVNS